MSEAELHVLRARLLGGQRAKASRGELAMRLPVGLLDDAAGRVVLDPDRQVQAAVRAYFATFRRTGSATATVRSFREQGLLFPRRLSSGPHTLAARPRAELVVEQRPQHAGLPWFSSPVSSRPGAGRRLSRGPTCARSARRAASAGGPATR
jgi:hypothetical protein